MPDYIVHTEVEVYKEKVRLRNIDVTSVWTSQLSLDSLLFQKIRLFEFSR